jgi:hypothetical protein
MEGLSGLVVGDDDERGLGGSANEERQVEGAGGKGESRHTTTTRAGAQVASHTLEGLRVLQVREELANEGENHAGISLPFRSARRCIQVGE